MQNNYNYDEEETHSTNKSCTFSHGISLSKSEKFHDYYNDSVLG